MKGIILAGGNGTRLRPMTKILNKSLLPIYDKPMIYYVIDTLKSLGCKEVMIISGKEHAGQIMNLLGAGLQRGVALTYRVQEEAGGIAAALKLCESFAGDDNIAVCLGDNIFENGFKDIKFESGAHIFLKDVPDPERFGIAEVTFNEVISIVEKPDNPKSNLCVTGLYLYDKQVWNIIKGLVPSTRGELEITDVNNEYIRKNQMTYTRVEGFWCDAGTPSSLAKATELVKETINYI
tara:strand:- start:846 stop:1553 length:708 start_codon:yes stop_codon:yes gene_type:complete